jgi:hypothetical protein
MQNTFINSVKQFDTDFWELIVKRYPKAYFAFNSFLKNLSNEKALKIKNLNDADSLIMMDDFFAHKGIEIKAQEFDHPLTGRKFLRFDYFESKNPLLKGKVYSGMPILAEQTSSIIFFKYLQAFEVLEQKIIFNDNFGNNKLLIRKNISEETILGIYHRWAQAS